MTPQQVAIITDNHINGIPQHIIADQIGVTRECVNRNLHKPAIQEQIAKIKAQLLDQAAQQSADNIIHVVQNYKAGIKSVIGVDKEGNPIEAIDTQLRDHGFKASLRILESIGMLPSHTAPTLIQINNHVELSPQLEHIMQLADHVGAAPDEAQEIIDL